MDGSRYYLKFLQCLWNLFIWFLLFRTKGRQSGFFSFHFARASPSLNGKSTADSRTSSGTASVPDVSTANDSWKDSKSSREGLTPEDRRLLAQLWSQVEPTGGSPPPPPPKPPLSLESPRWSAGESLADLPPSPLPDCLEPGYTNVRADVKLNAYLRSLAEAVQLLPISNRVTSGLMDESIYSSIDSPDVVIASSITSPSPPDLPPRNGSKQNGW